MTTEPENPLRRRTLKREWTVELEQDLSCYMEGPDGFPVRVYDSEMERMLTAEIEIPDEKDRSL